MRLSFSILLLVAAATQISAAVTPRAPSTCIAGSAGKGLGDGYKGYCCDDESDCIDDCVKGVCVGPSKPSGTTTTTVSKTTTSPTNSPTSGACIPGSKGLGNGDGYNGYCCADSDDCINSCVKGKCDGPKNTKTTTTTTRTSTKTTSTATTNPTPGACIPGSKGLGNGDGYNGYCCSDSDDCINTCVKGKCNGPVNTKTTTSVSKTTTSGTTSPTGSCKPGYKGKKNGGGISGVSCCSTDDDCQDTCVSGICGVHP